MEPKRINLKAPGPLDLTKNRVDGILGLQKEAGIVIIQFPICFLQLTCKAWYWMADDCGSCEEVLIIRYNMRDHVSADHKRKAPVKL